MVQDLGGFIEVIAVEFKVNESEMSGAKCVSTASNSTLGGRLHQKWKDMGLYIPYNKGVRSLGAGLGAGVRRNMQVVNARLAGMKARVPRFRWLRKLGIDAAMLVRTGGKQANTYGGSILGVSNSLLRDQRRVCAAAAGPTSGRGGENLDVALVLADGSAKGLADPAFDAHILPVGEWASAVWESWLPVISLERLIKHGKHRLSKTKKVWAVCYGPAAAYIATCQRLRWTVVSATKVVTDEGRELLLGLDSPAAVIREVKAAVVRWRLRNIEVLLPRLARGGCGAGALMDPIWQLLRSRQNDEDWNPTLRGGLRSVLANRQYPQVRVMAAGWSHHDRCLLCLHNILELEKAAELRSEPAAPAVVGDDAAEEVGGDDASGSVECPAMVGGPHVRDVRDTMSLNQAMSTAVRTSPGDANGEVDQATELLPTMPCDGEGGSGSHERRGHKIGLQNLLPLALGKAGPPFFTL